MITQGHRTGSHLARALQLRFQQQHGFDFSACCAFITSPFPAGRAEPPEGEEGPEWASPRGSGASVLVNLLTDPSAQLDFLVQKSPKYLATYPSNLQAFLKCSQENQLYPKGLEAVVLSSEPLSEDLIEFTQETWGARAVGTYSASEVGLVAAATPQSAGYYVQSESLHVEVLHDDGTECQPGEIGRVVVTTLQEFLRPLIRYEIGDYAEVGEPDASDPIQLPRLRRIVGRQRTMIQLPDGRRVWPHFEFSSLVKRGGVRQWQLVQRRDRSLLVRVVPVGTLSEELRLAVGDVVRDGLPGVEVEVVAVDTIERTARGKYLELVSELDA